MAYIYRLIIAFFCLFLLSAQSFAFDPVIGWVSAEDYIPTNKIYYSEAEACGAGVQYFPGKNEQYNDYVLLSSSVYSEGTRLKCDIAETAKGDPSVIKRVRNPIFVKSTVNCPANSKMVGGQCVCDAGFLETGKTCEPPQDDMCLSKAGKPHNFANKDNEYYADFGVQSASWVKKVIGSVQNSCDYMTGRGADGVIRGCSFQGSVDSCVSVPVDNGVKVACTISAPKYTGGKCDDQAGDARKDDQTCEPGYEPSSYAAGVCIPKENACQSGYVPSKYAAGVCIPEEKTTDDCENPKNAQERTKCQGEKSRCPKGQVESPQSPGVCVKGNKDGKDKDKDGNDVVCNGGVCVVGGGGGSGSGQTKPQSQFCKENADSKLCGKDDSDSAFGGSCGNDFTCAGDALQCSIAKEQHKRNCQLFENKTDESNWYESESAKSGSNITEDNPNNTEVDMATGIETGEIFGGKCIDDLRVDVMGASVTLPFSMLCQYLVILGNILVAVTGIVCAFILFRK